VNVGGPLGNTGRAYSILVVAAHHCNDTAILKEEVQWQTLSGKCPGMSRPRTRMR
jgi:hypothetical protein